MTAAEQYADANRVLGEMRAVLEAGTPVEKWSLDPSRYDQSESVRIQKSRYTWVVAYAGSAANAALIVTAVNALGPMLDGLETVLERHAPRMAGSRGPFCFACHTVTVASAPPWPCADARAVLGALGIEVGT